MQNRHRYWSKCIKYILNLSVITKNSSKKVDKKFFSINPYITSLLLGSSMSTGRQYHGRVLPNKSDGNIRAVFRVECTLFNCVEFGPEICDILYPERRIT